MGDEETMTNEEMKKHARRIVGMLDDLAINEQLDVIGLTYQMLGYTLCATSIFGGESESKKD